MKYLSQYSLISFGCFLFALGFTLFIKPYELAPGGISGVAVLLVHYLPNFDSGLMIFLLNTPLLLSGTKLLGRKFLYRTTWASCFSSVLITVFGNIFSKNVFFDIFTASVAGGILVGFGLGIVFCAHATTGGTDILVKLMCRKYPRISAAVFFLLFDTTVILLTAFVFRDIPIMIYSAFSLGVSMFCFYFTETLSDKIYFVQHNL